MQRDGNAQRATVTIEKCQGTRMMEEEPTQGSNLGIVLGPILFLLASSYIEK